MTMATKEVTKTSEMEIVVHWKEEEYYYPSAKFIAQVNMTDETVFDRFSLDKVPYCFKEYADLLDWYEYCHKILDTSDDVGDVTTHANPEIVEEIAEMVAGSLYRRS